MSNDHKFLNDVYLSSWLPRKAHKKPEPEPTKQQGITGFTKVCNRIKATNLKYQGRIK